MLSFLVQTSPFQIYVESFILIGYINENTEVKMKSKANHACYI